MTKSIDKSVEEIFKQSIKNTFVEKTEEVKEELTVEEKRRIDIAKAIEEAQLARKLAKEQELEEAEDAVRNASARLETWRYLSYELVISAQVRIIYVYACVTVRMCVYMCACVFVCICACRVCIGV